MIQPRLFISSAARKKFSIRPSRNLKIGFDTFTLRADENFIFTPVFSLSQAITKVFHCFPGQGMKEYFA